MSKVNNWDELHAEIDANLRKAYQQSLNEELPERLVDLIEKLRSGEEIDVSDAGNERAED